MHDGRFNTLEEVVEHYNSGGNYSSTVDPLMKKIGVGLQLTNTEKQDLINTTQTMNNQISETTMKRLTDNIKSVESKISTLKEQLEKNTY